MGKQILGNNGNGNAVMTWEWVGMGMGVGGSGNLKTHSRTPLVQSDVLSPSCMLFPSINTFVSYIL